MEPGRIFPIIADISITGSIASSTLATVVRDNTSFLSTAQLTGCFVMNVTGIMSGDNSQDPISFEVECLIADVILGVLLPVLFLINAPTNVINMAVFYKQGLRERINLCMFWRSLADFVFVFQFYCFYADRLYSAILNRPRFGVIVLFFFKTKLNILIGFHWTSAVTTTVIACERCFCVVSPLLSRNYVKTKTMAVILFSLSAVMLGGAYLVSMKINLICVFDPLTNSMGVTGIPSKEYLANKKLIDILQGIVLGLVLPVSCTTLVVITTIVTVISLRKMTEWRLRSVSSASSTMSARDLSLTRTLIFISIFFIFCRTPEFLINLSSFVFVDLHVGGRLSNMYTFMINVVSLFLYSNATFNFFIYYRTSSRFREVARSLRCICGGKKTKKQLGGNLSTECTNMSSV